MPVSNTSGSLSPKRAILCSRAHAERVADRIFTSRQSACIIRTGDPIQPYRAVAEASSQDEVEVLLCV
ncbi:hypothetical protein CA235_18230 [Sphingomonas sp. ABOLF]|jgi:hypothetical protein|nr:hypothetical protein CA235_18230 [Sphingomonas sp. ABOLF]TAJ29109.1 MAG: hypothetical protein EPO59_15795 [Bosea sp. (in: a-proteobacteria)]